MPLPRFHRPFVRIGSLIPVLALLHCGGGVDSGPRWASERIGPDRVSTFLVRDDTTYAVVGGHRLVELVAGGGSSERFDAGPGGAITGLTIAGNELFFAAAGPTGSRIVAIPFGGGEPRVIVDDTGGPATTDQPIAIVADDLFYIDPKRSEVLRTSVAGGGKPLVMHEGRATALWATPAHLYIGGRGVLRMPLQGGEATELIPAIAVRCGVVAGGRVFAAEGEGAASALHAVALDQPAEGGIARLRGVGCPLATHARRVYIGSPHSLMTFDPTSQSPPTIAFDLPSPAVHIVPTDESVLVSVHGGQLLQYRER